MGFLMKIPVHRVGGPKNVWDTGGYGLSRIWVTGGSTVYGLKLYRLLILGSTSNPTALAVRTLIPKGSLGIYFTLARMETQILNPPC